VSEAAPTRATACAFLRTKHDFYAVHEGSLEKIYWCGKTLGQFGPDGEIAELETCQRERSCWCDTIAGNALPLISPEEHS
jgi:hypothetical protein